MFNLLLSVLCSVLIANLLMVFNRRGDLHIMPVFLGNYLMASIFGLFSLKFNLPVLPVFDVLLGVAAGGLFLANFWVYQRSIVINGLSLSVGVMRIAMIIPILLAVLVFREKLSLWNGLGILAGLAAFSLRADPRQLRNFLWILALFAISGLTDASLKVFKELGSGAESAFVLVIFASAFFFTLATILARRIPISLQSILLGCVLGIPNRYSTVFFLKSLDSVPASIAYPLVAVSIVLLSIVSDLAIWKKRATQRDAILWVLLLLSLVLLNLR